MKYHYFISSKDVVVRLPIYTLTGFYDHVSESTDLNITIDAINVPVSATVYWEIIPVKGNVNSADFSAMSGTVNLTNGHGVLTIGITKDRTTEEDIEQFRVRFRDTNSTGTIITHTFPITILDTSQNPRPRTGYFAGGNYADSSISSYVQKLDFSTNISTRLTTRLSVSRNNVAGVSSENKGYIAGGSTSSTTSTNRIDYILYSTESTAACATNLVTSRYGSCGMQTLNEGYWATGFSSPIAKHVGEIDGVLFSNDTRINPTATISTPRRYVTGVSSETKGYIAGGRVSGYYKTINRFMFDTLTSDVNLNTLTSPRQSPVGVFSSINGYICGGYDGTLKSQSSVDKINFSNDSVNTSSVSLSNGRYGGSGANDILNGYVVGGTTASATRVSTVDIIGYSTEVLQPVSVSLAYAFTGAPAGVNTLG